MTNKPAENFWPWFIASLAFVGLLGVFIIGGLVLGWTVVRHLWLYSPALGVFGGVVAVLIGAWWWSQAYPVIRRGPFQN